MTFLLPLLEMFAEFAGTVVSPFCSLLFCLQQIKLANIEASATSFVASCSLSFNPSLCRLSPPSAAPMSLFQGHFASVSKFSQKALEESGSKQM